MQLLATVNFEHFYHLDITRIFTVVLKPYNTKKGQNSVLSEIGLKGTGIENAAFGWVFIHLFFSDVFLACLATCLLAVGYQGTKWLRQYLHSHYRDKM